MGRILPRKRCAIACREDNRGEGMNIENKASCANRGIGRALVGGVRRGAKGLCMPVRASRRERIRRSQEGRICPACIASTAMMVVGAGSTGGILMVCIGK